MYVCARPTYEAQESRARGRPDVAGHGHDGRHQMGAGEPAQSVQESERLRRVGAPQG